MALRDLPHFSESIPIFFLAQRCRRGNWKLRGIMRWKTCKYLKLWNYLHPPPPVWFTVPKFSRFVRRAILLPRGQVVSSISTKGKGGWSLCKDLHFPPHTPLVTILQENLWFLRHAFAHSCPAIWFCWPKSSYTYDEWLLSFVAGRDFSLLWCFHGFKDSNREGVSTWVWFYGAFWWFFCCHPW